MTEPILYEQHMHTPLCKHARGEPEDYAAVAQRRGLKGIVVTCHNPTNDGWSPTVRMSENELDDYVALVERARETWEGRVDVRVGMESDYVPGMEAWLEDLHGRADFNHVLGSVHPHLKDYKERYFTGDLDAFRKTYFEHIAMAAETELFDTIAHPDLVKIVEPAEWNYEPFADAVRDCLDRIAATGTAMELNTSGLNKTIGEIYPGPEMLGEMQQRGIPVVMGADAHDPHRVSANFEDALEALSDAGYVQVSLFLDRQRQDHSIDQVFDSLVADPTAA